MQAPVALPGYERLAGTIPVVHPPRLAERARGLLVLLRDGAETLSGLLETEPPELEALLIAESDWAQAPREGRRAYPYGLPYFTRSIRPPALVLPEDLTPMIRPRTSATWPLVVWHELAHAFLLRREVVRTPAWLGELIPQAASATVALRVGLPLEEYLSNVDPSPGFTVRSLGGRADAQTQMAFQNLLLGLGAAALAEFGEGWLKRLVHALWGEQEIVSEGRAEEMLADALGPRGREWLRLRPEFGELAGDGH
ncbi:MAG: hypothetical protein CYG60_02770 [Actinobacteria bacterium]|nr:MAG: hypothetical protein CYG60_02770 [Actinomycetota bacterium]